MDNNTQNTATPRSKSKASGRSSAPAKNEQGGFDTTLRIHDNALRVLEKRYLRKDIDGNPVERAEDMFKRVSLNIAEADRKFNPKADIEAIGAEFYEMMARLEFLPNSPTLMNAGRDLQQLSACFVLPIGDSMESIFETLKNTALIHKSGGGTGFSFSKLRPSGDIVGSTSGISSGPVSFMSVFDSATEAIKQGGTRRGANMGILRVDHPDIMNFIDCKTDNEKLNNFNISINITEDFMEALEKDEDYNILSPRTGEVMDTRNAREVFDKVVNNAWQNGEPGIIFIDRINEFNPTPNVGDMESTNPCGEQPLLPYESCNLGSINLSRMIIKNEDGGYDVDWDRVRETTHKATHFLDNVIEMNRYPIKEIDETTKSNRKIGLGVMGFSDMLIRLGIPYNSEEAIEMADEVMGFIHREGHEASKALARERGPFPNIKGSIYEDEPRRNATVTTIAPTGTISILGGCSSGIEPLFALAFVRNVMDGTELLEVNPLFEEMAKEEGVLNAEILKQVAKTGSLQDVEGMTEKMKKVFVTSHEIGPEWHIRMQAAFQKYTDNAVSKTVNFSNDATVEDVAKVYKLAYKLGCKGVTVYRDGSRDAQVLTRGSEKKADAAEALPAKEGVLKPRGEVAIGITKKMVTGCGNLYVTINNDAEGNPVEIFTQIGKAGGCATSQCEAIGRMASLAMQGGIKPEEIVKQMKGISCHLPVGFGGSKVLSCSDAMAQAMEWYVNLKNSGQSVMLGSNSEVGASPDINAITGLEGGHASGASIAHSGPTFTLSPDVQKRGACPDCGGTVEHADGCVVCRGCGYTECG